MSLELPWFIGLPIVGLQVYVVYRWGLWYESRKEKEVEANRDNF